MNNERSHQGTRKISLTCTGRYVSPSFSAFFLGRVKGILWDHLRELMIRVWERSGECWHRFCRRTNIPVSRSSICGIADAVFKLCFFLFAIKRAPPTFSFSNVGRDKRKFHIVLLAPVWTDSERKGKRSGPGGDGAGDYISRMPAW